MSDTENLAAQYANHQKALKDANAVNKQAVFDALARAGIATVTVNFDGEGDSGQIGDMVVEGHVVVLPDRPVEIQDAPWGADTPVCRKAPLPDALERLCYDYLSQEHDGWEIDDGAFGEFTFDVAGRRIALDFNDRFSDSVHTSHSF